LRIYLSEYASTIFLGLIVDIIYLSRERQEILPSEQWEYYLMDVRQIFKECPENKWKEEVGKSLSLVFSREG
jgi:hypothetical protein